MFEITINEKGGPSRSLDFDKNEVTIGRVQGNDVVLPKGNISKRHSRIVVKDGKFIIIDMQSTNGTYVNGKKITTPQVIKSTDKIYIGDFTLQLGSAKGEKKEKDDAPPPSVPSAPPGPESRAPTRARTQSRSDDELEDELDAKKAGTPGLIDDSFDREFDVDEEPAGRRGAPSRRPKNESDAPEAQKEVELDLSPPEDDEVVEEDDDDLAAKLAPEPEEELAPEPEERPAAPLQLKKRPAASRSGASSSSKSIPSVPRGGRRAQKSEEIALDLREEETPVPEMAHDSRTPAPSLPAAPTAAPGPIQAMPSPVVPFAPPLTSLPAQMTPGLPSAMPLPSLHGGMAGGMTGSLPPLPMSMASMGGIDHRTAVRELHLSLVEELGLAGVPVRELQTQLAGVRRAAKSLGERLRGRLLPGVDLDAVINEAVSCAADLGPLNTLLVDDEVLEVVITQSREIFADRNAQLAPTGQRIAKETDVIRLIRLFAALGGASPDQPLIDVRLRDGSRVVAAQPPLAFRGPTLSLRRSMREAYAAEDLVANRALSRNMVTLIEHALRYRRGILIAVGPGPVGSATLNGIGSLVPAEDRIVTIERGIELHLGHANVVALEPSEKFSVADLVDHAVSRQPDRVLLGLLNGQLRARMLQHLAGPLQGAVACYAANTAEEALEGMAYELKAELPLAEAKRLVARAAPLVLQEERLNYFRYVTKISELVIDGDRVRVEDIFYFEPTGVDAQGELEGAFRATGYIPQFLEDVGDQVDLKIFQA